MRISDWSSDVCSSDLAGNLAHITPGLELQSTIILSVSGLLPRTRFDTIALPSLSFSTPMRCDVASSITLTWAPRIDSRLSRSGLERSEERRVGKEWVSTCRFRWSPVRYKKNQR